MKTNSTPRLGYLRRTAPNDCYIEAVEIKSEKDLPRGVNVNYKRRYYTVEGYTGYGSNIDRLVKYPFGKILSGPKGPYQFLGIFDPSKFKHIQTVVRFVDDKGNQ